MILNTVLHAKPTLLRVETRNHKLLRQDLQTPDLDFTFQTPLLDESIPCALSLHKIVHICTDKVPKALLLKTSPSKSTSAADCGTMRQSATSSPAFPHPP